MRCPANIVSRVNPQGKSSCRVFNVLHTISSFNDKKDFNADFNDNHCWNEILRLSHGQL